ncbi:MAG TPA: hypothetical protein VNM92_09110 [Thermoanaerobaculia bacterium]|nr:hypothetical protein [Thermoanaerobaculia bacterium]
MLAGTSAEAVLAVVAFVAPAFAVFDFAALDFVAADFTEGDFASDALPCPAFTLEVFRSVFESATRTPPRCAEGSFAAGFFGDALEA